VIILGWIIWSLLLLLALTHPLYIRREISKGKVVHPAQLFQALAVWVIIVAFYVQPWNKLHILWILPIAFILSFITTARIAVISRVSLSLSYFYLGIICLGMKTPDKGVYVYDPYNLTKEEEKKF